MKKKTKKVATSAADVWRILGELAEAQKHTERAIKSLIAEGKRTEAAQQRTEAERKKLAAEVAAAQKDTAETLKALTKESKRAEAELQKSIDKANGNFNNKWGQFLENLVAGDFIDLMAQIGIKDLDNQSQNQVVRDKSTGHPLAEFDLVAKNKTKAVGAEVKTELSCQDVDNFVDDLKNHGPRVFRGYESVYGVLVFLKATKRVREHATAKGLILIQAPGGKNKVSTIVNPAGFKPKAFDLKKHTPK